VDNKCLQKEKDFKYLGCEISYDGEKDVQQKLSKFSQILAILYNPFKTTLVQKFSKIRVHNALAVHFLLHGSEIWTPRKKSKKRLALFEIKFFMHTVRYTIFGQNRNDEILEELKVEEIHEKLRRYVITLAMTCNKNEQQQDVKNNEEL